MVAWQIQSSLRKDVLIEKTFIGPVRFYARKGLTGITGNIYTGLHEFYDMAFLLHFLRPGDLFFDIGANVGSYSLLASGVCRASTIAMEASSETAGLLSANVALNQLGARVSVIHAAAGPAKGTIRFSLSGDTQNHVLPRDQVMQESFETVPVLTVDSLSEDEQPRLIKIDVEGFETEVMNGMPVTLLQPGLKAIIIELNGSGGRYGFDEREIHERLLACGFRPYTYCPFKHELTLLETYGPFNTIYCRDLPFISQRLIFATRFEIMGEKI